MEEEIFRIDGGDRDNDAFPINDECPVCHGYSDDADICDDCRELCDDL